MTTTDGDTADAGLEVDPERYYMHRIAGLEAALRAAMDNAAKFAAYADQLSADRDRLNRVVTALRSGPASGPGETVPADDGDTGDGNGPVAAGASQGPQAREV